MFRYFEQIIHTLKLAALLRGPLIASATVLLFFNSCTFKAEISDLLSKKIVAIEKNDIVAISPSAVVIKLQGQCLISESKIALLMDKKQLKTKTGISLSDIDSETAIISCSKETNEINVIIHVPDPDNHREIDFDFYDKEQESVKYRYTVNYVRPAIVTPLISAAGTAANSSIFDFSKSPTLIENTLFTNDTSLNTLSGVCNDPSITHLEWRFGAQSGLNALPWQRVEYATFCQDKKWTWSPGNSFWTDNPILDGDYSFEIRAINTQAKDSASQVSQLKITLDRQPPQLTAPDSDVSVVGVASQSDTIFDNWLGFSNGINFKLNLGSELTELQVALENEDHSVVICSKTVPASDAKFANSIVTLLNSECNTTNLIHGLKYQIVLKGKDAAGNQSSDQLNYPFTIDKQNDTITLTSSPAVSTTNDYASFAFSITGTTSPLHSTQCKLDNETWKNCDGNSVEYYDLSPGVHTYNVKVTDVAGNASNKTFSWTITTDLQNPICQFDNTDTWFNTTSVTIQFSCTDNEVIRSALCSLNGQAWQNCTSTSAHNLTSLTDGTYTIGVRARDNAGLFSTNIQKTIYIDTQAPQVLFTLQPLNPSRFNYETISASISDGLTGIKSIECRLAPAAFSACQSVGFTVGTMLANSTTTLMSLAEGTHTFEIRVTDRAENSRTEALTWVSDFTAPLAPVLEGASIEDGPRKPTWKWISGGGDGSGVYRYKMDSDDFTSGATTISGLEYRPTEILTFGQHTLYVQEKDAAGNWSVSGQKTYEIKCGPGEYFVGDSCLLCPAGQYQSSINLSPTCQTVGSGQFTASPGASAPDLCTNKPPNALSVTYDSSTGLTTNTCPVSEVLACQGPNYVIDTSTNKTTCRALCAAGTYWTGSQCDAVQAGYYSPDFDDSRYQCQAGYYGSSANNISATCDGPCLAGYTCDVGSTDSRGTGALCPVGYECPLGSSTPLLCADNKYTDNPGSAACTSCPAGSTIQSSNASDHDSLTDCQSLPGYYNCHSGTCQPAGQGNYSPAGDDNVYLCSAGRYGSTLFNQNANCDGPCAAGNYCLAGSTGATGAGICDDNTYSTGGASAASCTSCPVHSVTQGTGASSRDQASDCLGEPGYYNCETGTCLAAGSGYYSGAFSNSRQACPANSKTLGTTSATIDDCLGDTGYYNCQFGTCQPATATEYSTDLSNDVFTCPEHSFTGTTASERGSVNDCKAGVDFYDDDASLATTPVPVGTGFYSAYRDDSRSVCTNMPPNALSVTYSGSGNGSNNCPVGSVLVCSVGYIVNGTTCLDNSPGTLTFTNDLNADPNTLISSNSLVLSDFDGPLTATCVGCSGIARNGVWGGTSVDGFMPGDTIALQLTSSSSYSTSKMASITIGVTTSSDWIVGTRAPYNCTGTSWGTVNHLASQIGYAASNPVPPETCQNETRTCTDGVFSGSFMATTCSEGCSGTPWGEVPHGYSNVAYSATESPNCASISETRICSNGVMSGSRTITTCLDNTPDPINFTNVSNQNLSSTITSNAVTVSGFDGPRAATCTNCIDIARNGVWGGTSVSGFMPGDTIAIKVTSSASFSTAITASATLGTTTSNVWSVTTRAANNCSLAGFGTINHGSSVTAYSNSTPLPPTTCAGSAETRTCNDGVLSGTYSNASCNNGCASTPWGNVTHGYSQVVYSSSNPAGSCSSVATTRTCNNGTFSGSGTNTSCTEGCTGTPWGNVSHGYSNTAYTSSAPAGSCASVSSTRTCSNGFLSGSGTATSCTSGCTGTPWGSVSHGYSNTAYSSSTATTPTTCSSLASTRTCSAGVLSGSGTATSCTQSCGPQAVTWSAYNCTGSITTTASVGGSSGSISNTTMGKSGSATYTCTSSGWSISTNECGNYTASDGVLFGSYAVRINPSTFLHETNGGVATGGGIWGFYSQPGSLPPGTCAGVTYVYASFTKGINGGVCYRCSSGSWVAQPNSVCVN